MKTQFFIYLFLFCNLSFGQTQVLIDNPWRLDKFIIGGSDVTYTDQSNHYHFIGFQDNGSFINLVSLYCQTLFGLICVFDGNQFSYENFYSYGIDCEFNSEDVVLLMANTSFYFNSNNNNNFNYEINELENNVKQLIITNSSNNTAVYRSVNLSVVNFNNDIDLIVYPNPVDKKLQFKSNFEVKKINVFSIEGKFIETYLINPESQVDVSNLKSGIYFFEFNVNDKLIRKKIIKK